MIRYKFADVLLVQFPFTDGISKKLRPTIVISSPRYNASFSDIIVMAITSQFSTAQDFGTIALIHWKHAGLIKDSWIKPSIATVLPSRVKKSLGGLHAEDVAALKSTLRAMLG